MELTSSPALLKTRSNRWIIGLLFAVILGGSVAGGLLMQRRARARRAAIVERERRTAAAQASGEDIRAARAMANYLARIRGQLHDHEVALQRLQHENVLSWNIHDRAEIESGRRLIQEFLATNTRLADSTQYGADLILAELNTAKVPTAVRDSALALYTKSQAGVIPLQMRVRHYDQVLGENALAILDLLDVNWGLWRRDDATGRLDFTSTVTLAAFQDYAEKAKAAANDREQTQKEVAIYQRLHPTP